MPVNATIPLTQDFLETAGTYPLLTELIQHPTNGYLYGCYTEVGVGKIVKLKDDYSDVTVANLPVTAPIDMHYSATNDRFYVVYRTTNSPVTEVHPATLAMAEFFSIVSVGGQGAIAGDTSNLYVATFSTQKLYSISLATGLQVGLRTMPATGYAKINCLRYFSPKLYALSMDVDYVQLSRIATANLGTEEVSQPIGIDVGEVPVDDMGESTGHIYVGNRDLLGIIRKFSKTDFLNPELIETTQLSKCTCVKRVGSFVWAAFENGRGVRINPDNVPDRRIYTLNAGQGYHSEFTGVSNEFVHTYNLSTGKIARYRIPPDVVSGALQWVNVTTRTAGLSSSAAWVSGVTTDINGDVIVTGQFLGTANFGDGDINSANVGRSTDAFIVKYSSTGSLIWKLIIGNDNLGSPDIGNAIATDRDGNIFIIGTFGGTVDFGNGHSVISAGATGNIVADVFVAKYSPGSQGVPGTCQWAKNFGNSTSDEARAIAIDSEGDVLISMGSAGDVTIGAFLLSASGMGIYDVILTKLSGDTGVPIWAKRWGGTGQDYAYGLAIHGDFFYACGATQGGGNFGATLTAGAWIGKYNLSDGTYANWSLLVNATQFNTVAVDTSTGSVFVGGSHKVNTQCNLGGGLRGGGSSTGGFFVVSYNPTLMPATSAWRWDKFAGTGSTDSVNGVGLDSALGKVVITGKCNSSLNFTGEPFVQNFGPFTMCFATFDGTKLWVQSSNESSGGGSQGGLAIAITASHAIPTGGFAGTVKFSPTVSKSTSSQQINNGYVAKYAL